MAASLLGAVALLAAFATGFGLARHLDTGRIEAMHAAMTASRADTGPYRRALAEQHLAGWRWRSSLRHWIQLHLHWRAAA